jgi:sugar O-acyltransferase (sialic acid O-acetyltransferase NeuD family)
MGIDQRVALVGGGGHALVAAQLARLSGRGVVGFFDDDEACACATKLGLAWMGPLAAARAIEDRPCILAVGSLQLRRRLIHELSGLNFVSLSWCDASLVELLRVRVGRGAMLGLQCIVQSHAVIGDHAIINSGAIIEHECEVGENAHVAPGAVLGGDVRVGRDTLIGLGARVLPGLVIGSKCVIGAGAVVTRDVEDGVKVVGVPGRESGRVAR